MPARGEVGATTGAAAGVAAGPPEASAILGFKGFSGHILDDQKHQARSVVTAVSILVR